MALNGSTSVAFTSYDNLKFSWSATQSTANNSSTVAWQLELVSGKYGLIESSYAKAYTIVVDGNTYSGTNYINISNNTTKTLVSGTTVVKHNADGTKTFNFSITQAIKINWNGEYIGTKSFSGSGVLDNIPRHATLLNAPDFKNTTIPQIQISNPLGEDIEALKVCIALDEAGSNVAVAWQNIPKDEIDYLFSITTSEREKLAKAVTGTTTTNIWYILSSTVGGVAKTSKLKRTYTIENAKPFLDYSVYDGNSTTSKLTGDTSKFIKFYSNIIFTFAAHSREYATITSKSTTYQGDTSTSDNGVFSNIESNIITFSATDNRNQTTTESVELDIIEYSKLTCNLKVENPTAAGDASITINGNFFNGSFGAQSNNVTLSYRIKPEGGSYGSWKYLSGTANGNNYTITSTITGLDYQTTYTVQARAVDRLSSVFSKEIVIKSVPTFDWGKDDFNFNCDLKMKGNTVLRATDEKKVVLSAEGAEIYLRPNGSTTDSGQLRLNTDGTATLNGSQIITSGMVADYVIEQGDNGAYAYTKWNSGKLEAWRTSQSSITAAITSAYNNMYYADSLTLTTTGNASQFTSVQCIQLTFNKNDNIGLYYPVVKRYAINNGAVTVTYMLANPSSRDSASVGIPNLYIIGRWK